MKMELVLILKNHEYIIVIAREFNKNGGFINNWRSSEEDESK